MQWRTMTAWRLASVCCLAVYMSYAVTSGRTCWKEACRHRASHHSKNGLRPIDPAVVNTAATKCLSMVLHPCSCLSIFLASAAYSVTANVLRTNDGSIGLMHVLSQHVGHCSGLAGSMNIPSIVLLFFSECRRCWPRMEDIPHHFRSCFDATSSQALWRMVEMWLMLHCVWWYPWGMVSWSAPSMWAWHLGEHR